MAEHPTNKTGAGRIAIFLPSLEGGGAERSMLNLTRGFLAKGRSVDIVLCRARGAYLGDIPEGANMIELTATPGPWARCVTAINHATDIPALTRPVLLARKIAPEVCRVKSLQDYIAQHRPDVILSALPYCNLAAIWAKQRSGGFVPVVVSERIVLSTYCAAFPNASRWRWRYLPELVRQTYPGADAVVAVSNEVADDLRTRVGLVHDSINTIYNPVVDDDLRRRAQEPIEHKWFEPDAPPVILGVGRFTEQKDFATLIQAFATVRKSKNARLVLLGEGRLREELEEQALRLGIAADVDLPGFVENPFRYMMRASVLVLSSRYEGLPGAIIQALACGCPVVSTDCPGGSREILAAGQYGTLVDIGDATGMAQAIRNELDRPRPRETLLTRAEDFSVARGVEHYLKLLDEVVRQAPGNA
jgi:glycosyltransferase involved in cell wall biosynthesis